jgi:hypothetical protein
MTTSTSGRRAQRRNDAGATPAAVYATPVAYPSVVPSDATIAAQPAVAVTPPTCDGVNYVADVYGSFADASSLADLPAVNVDAVAVVTDFGIDAVNSNVYDNDVDGGFTESDANIAATISNATTLGLSVMVRPLIDFLPSNYSTGNGQPNPANGAYAAGESRCITTQPMSPPSLPATSPWSLIRPSWRRRTGLACSASALSWISLPGRPMKITGPTSSPPCARCSAAN